MKKGSRPPYRVVSYSQYMNWAKCPLQWKLTTVDKLAPFEDNIHAAFGQAMHTVIQHWLNILFNESKIKAKTIDLGDMYKAELIKEFRERTHEEDGEKIYLSDLDTLMEFYEDGLNILSHLQEDYSKYFDTLEYTLEGIEIPLRMELKKNVHFRGYVDIVLRHKLTGAIKIIDLKTSTKGWNKWRKKDKTRTNQLLIYKKFYSKVFDIPEDAISVEFIILRRKLWEESPYPMRHLSRFSPAHGQRMTNQAAEHFLQFVTECFDENGYVTDHIEPTPSAHACRFCPFLNTEHCDVGIAPE